jgi:hypothetical protein
MTQGPSIAGLTRSYARVKIGGMKFGYAPTSTERTARPYRTSRQVPVRGSGRAAGSWCVRSCSHRSGLPGAMRARAEAFRFYCAGKCWEINLSAVAQSTAFPSIAQEVVARRAIRRQAAIFSSRHCDIFFLFPRTRYLIRSSDNEAMRANHNGARSTDPTPKCGRRLHGHLLCTGENHVGG